MLWNGNGDDPVKSTMVSRRRWALYGGFIAAVYTGLGTYPDHETRSFALYSGKLIAASLPVSFWAVSPPWSGTVMPAATTSSQIQIARLNFKLSFPRR